ncbi:hypothetical protein SmJEL517_g02909 [Synchytrium microbalum]|uniref:Uncharacterized protein n=1 Tax=Synchytrium microbalum TaxID=1806994 RepID=A0A507C4D6_9FUNG|nr:uncharacterized protein SmJEL517_g02909 [Synchytrium microbalum]TPX34522.1 hypothetical protein SmJEL517_g02909 [Synchytrium microbalum]
MRFVRAKIGEFNGAPFYLYTCKSNSTHYLNQNDVDTIFLKRAEGVAAHILPAWKNASRYMFQTPTDTIFLSFEALANIANKLQVKELQSLVNCSRDEICSGKANPSLVKTGLQAYKRAMEIVEEDLEVIDTDIENVQTEASINDACAVPQTAEPDSDETPSESSATKRTRAGDAAVGEEDSKSKRKRLSINTTVASPKDDHMTSPPSETNRRNSRNSAGLSIQTSQTLPSTAIAAQTLAQLATGNSAGDLPTNAPTHQTSSVVKPPVSMAPPPPTRAPGAGATTRPVSKLAPRPLPPVGSHPSLVSPKTEFGHSINSNAPSDNMAPPPRSPLHMHPPPSPLYANSNSSTSNPHSQSGVPMTPTTTTAATGFPVSRQNFMSIFETMYDQVESNARLRVTLEEQLRSSARLLATLQASGAMIETLVRTQFREMQLIYGERFGSALTDLNRRMVAIEQLVGMDTTAGGSSNGTTAPAPATTTPAATTSNNNVIRIPVTPGTDGPLTAGLGGLVGSASSSHMEAGIKALSERLETATEKASSSSSSSEKKVADA